MKYRPVAPEDLDKVVSDLKRLMGETVLPWQHDHSTGEFFVEVDGKVYPISFGNGDAETLLVQLLTANLDLLLNAIEGRFVIIDREWSCKPTKKDSPGSTTPATESSSGSGGTPPSAPSGSKAKSGGRSAKRSSVSAKSSGPKKRAKSVRR